MLKWLKEATFNKLLNWLIKEPPVSGNMRSDFERLRYEIRPGDVILVEGNTRIAEVIKMSTNSNWTHAALYIGRLYDIEDPSLRTLLNRAFNGEPDEQLLIEAVVGQGTVVSPLERYAHEHLRICRPNGLSHTDAQLIIANATNRLGTAYDVRQILDLGRFLFPYAILPRRWRSTLFEHNPGETARTVCSCLIAEAFHSIQFPILPFIAYDENGELWFHKHNPRLFTPKDFDYSPYFDIIKYPYLGMNEKGLYRKIPWHQSKNNTIKASETEIMKNIKVITHQTIKRNQPSRDAKYLSRLLKQLSHFLFYKKEA